MTGMVDYTQAELVLGTLLQPKQRNLGYHLGWDQPTETDWVNLGEEFTVKSTGWYTLPELFPGEDGEETRQELRRLIKQEATRYTYNYEQEDDSIKPEGYLDVAVSVPFASLEPLDRVRYRLLVILMNYYGPPDDQGHDWALSTREDLASNYWARESTKRTGWAIPDWVGPLDFEALSYLVEHVGWEEDFDFSPYCDTYEEVEVQEFDERELPALPWVRETGLVQRLFALEDEWEVQQVEPVVAYALEAVQQLELTLEDLERNN
jgi:hypothetical protein